MRSVPRTYFHFGCENPTPKWSLCDLHFLEIRCPPSAFSFWLVNACWRANRVSILVWKCKSSFCCKNAIGPPPNFIFIWCEDAFCTPIELPFWYENAFGTPTALPLWYANAFGAPSAFSFWCSLWRPNCLYTNGMGFSLLYSPTQALGSALGVFPAYHLYPRAGGRPPKFIWRPNCIFVLV